MNKEELNKILQYPVKGSLITIGGRPAMGKRTFALNLVELFCKEGHKCLYVTDYNKQIITEMLLKIVANPNRQECLEIQTEKFTQAVKELSSWNLFIKSTEFCRIKNIKQIIQNYKPDYLFIMGASAANAILDVQDSISRLRGHWLEYTDEDGRKIPALASFHPAYLLRNPGQKAKSWVDFLRLKQKMSEDENKQ